MLLKLLVAKAIFSFAEANTRPFLGSKGLIDLVTESICVWLGLREARCLAKGKLLLRGRAIANGSFTNTLVCLAMQSIRLCF